MKGIRLSVAAALLAGAASGADPGDVVVTGTRTPEASQRATVKTDVVTRAEAERRGATTVAEALASQPGVQVNPGAYGYLGGISPIQIQGFDLGRVLILEDGEPVIGDIGGAIDLSTIPIGDVQRIEIVTGPTSALYGSNAIGGVINIITARPRDEGWSGRGRAEARSRRGALLQAATALRRDRRWVAVDAGLTRQDGVVAREGLPDLSVPDSARSLVGVRAGTSLTDDADVQVRARWLRQNQEGLRSQEYPGLGRYVISEPSTTDRVALHLQELVRFGRGSSLRLSLGRQWSRRVSSSAPEGSPVGQEQHKSQGLQSLEATMTLADGPRTWVAGARFQARDFSQHLVRRESVGGELVTRDEEQIAPATRAIAALYGQLQWRVGERLTVLPGVRGEAHGRQGSVVAPRLAAALRPSERWTLRASAGRGFRAPSAEELGFNFDHSMYGYKVAGNPDLAPERSWGVNGDVTWRPDGRTTLRGGGFMNWVEDLIDVDLGAGAASGAVITYTYRNFERVRTVGAQLGATFRVADGFRAEVTYDHLWTRDDSAGLPLPGRPPHTVTSSLRWEVPWRLELYARSRYVSDAFVDRATRTPGYETIDLRVGRAISTDGQLYAGVLNLLDVRQEPGRIGDMRPPAGRVVYLGVRATIHGEDNP